MEANTLLIIAAVVGLGVGFLIAQIASKNKGNGLISQAKQEAQRILNSAKKDGEQIKKDKKELDDSHKERAYRF